MNRHGARQDELLERHMPVLCLLSVLFLAGAIVGSSITDQAHQVLKNLSAVLREAGSGMDKVVKTTCFLADMQDFAPFNEVYAQYFTGKPARSCVAVRTLPKNVLVEVECIAVVA